MLLTTVQGKGEDFLSFLVLLRARCYTARELRSEVRGFSSLALLARCCLRILGRRTKHHAFISRATRELLHPLMIILAFPRFSFISRASREMLYNRDHCSQGDWHFHISRYERDAIFCQTREGDGHASFISRATREMIPNPSAKALACHSFSSLALCASCYTIRRSASCRAGSFISRVSREMLHGGLFVSLYVNLSSLALRASCYL